MLATAQTYSSAPSSHDIHKELAGVAHRHVKGLPAGRQLGRNGRQVPDQRWRSGRNRRGRGAGGLRRHRMGRHHHQHHRVVGQRDPRSRIRVQRRRVVRGTMRPDGSFTGRAGVSAPPQAAPGGVLGLATRAGLGVSSTCGALLLLDSTTPITAVGAAAPAPYGGKERIVIPPAGAGTDGWY